MRRAFAVVAGLMLCAPMVSPSQAASGGAQNIDELVESFSACVSREQSADVLILLDQSASLSQGYQSADGRQHDATDPEDRRVPAAEDVVDQLRSYAEDTGVEVNVAVAGFDGNFREGAGWTPVNDRTLPTIRQQVKTVGAEDGGLETDYYNAIDGASKVLAQGKTQCQLLIFFTDGEYDVDGSYGPKAYSSADDWKEVEKQGKELLCDPKRGPLNAIRTSGVYVVGVGLSGGSDVSRMEFLRDITTGSSCGKEPAADRWAYLDVASASSLVFELSKVTAGTVTEEQTDAKGRSSIRFGLDPIITSVSVLADAADARLKVELVDPEGRTVATSSNSGVDAANSFETTVTQLGPATTRFRVRPAGSGDLSGTWTVRFLPKPGERVGEGVLTRTNVTVKSDLRPSWVDQQSSLPTGTESTIRAQLVSKATGSQVAGRDVPGGSISLVFRDAGGQVSTLVGPKPLAEWEAGVPVAFAAGGQPLPTGKGKLAFNLDIRMTTKPVTDLATQVTAYDVELVAPPQYPTVDASPVVLTGEAGKDAEGVSPSKGVIAVRGPGCVWLDEGSTVVESLPNGIDEGQIGLQSEFGSQTTCMSIEEGTNAEFPLQAVTTVPGYGAFAGKAVLKTAPEGTGEPLSVVVPFTAERSKAVNVTTQVGLLLLALLFGLGIPALILMAVRAATARILVSDPEAGDLAYVVKSVPAGDGRLQEVSLDRRDVRNAHGGSESSVRALVVEGINLKALAWGNPFVVADVRADSPGARLVSDFSGGRGRAGSTKLPLALAGHWIAWSEPGGIRVLYFFSTNDLRSKDLSELSGRLNESLEAHADVLTNSRGESVVVGPGAGNFQGPSASGWDEPPGQGAGGGAAGQADPDDWLKSSWDDDWNSGSGSKDDW